MAHNTVVDASSAAGGGAVPSVRGFGRVDLQHATGLEKGASEMSERAKYVRNCARGRAKDLSNSSMSHWLFFRPSTHFFRGIDVRPVMLGATCYIASANDTEPCKRLGDVC